MRNQFIEYYGEHGISPVKQDLSDIRTHCAKREKLYRQLGIPCIAFEGKKVLEIGPGSGYNTLAYFFWGGYCTLVEPNETGVLEMKKLFADYRIPPDRYLIKECTIEEADIHEEFDIVIAEGFLHSVYNGDKLVRKISGFVKEGGAIVITCMDSLSMFVEQMKRLVCHILIKDISDYEKQVQQTVIFFEGQMKSATGMSRNIEDWIRDDMLNPAFNSESILSMEKAFAVFPKEFSLLGSSQKIFTDYSWYKDLAYDERAELLHQYKAKRHNFMFMGLNETILSEDDSEFLEKAISEIRTYSREYEKDHSNRLLDRVEEGLNAIRPIMGKIDEACVCFVDDVIGILESLKAGQTVSLEKYEAFYAAIGRTQQYLSMVRRKA